MPQTEAEKIVAAIRAALPPSSAISPEEPAKPLSPGAVLALVAANAVPLLGVLLGAFMAIHVLFIYDLFVRGTAEAGRETGAVEALTEMFAPLWPALLALFLSHGVSFALNFLGRAEHRGMKLAALMASPCKRVVLMQLTLIFGGWITLLLHDARPALALLVALKIAADVHAHRRERALSLA